jgi:hypothetical protein
LGVSLRTVHRMLKAGEVVVDDTNSVRTSNTTPSYFVRDPSTKSVPPDMRTKSVPRSAGEDEA